MSAVRVASLPQFNIDGRALRAAFANAGDTLKAETEFEKLDGGPELLNALTEARRRLASAER